MSLPPKFVFSVPQLFVCQALLPLIATAGFATTYLTYGYSIRIWQPEDGSSQK